MCLYQVPFLSFCVYYVWKSRCVCCFTLSLLVSSHSRFLHFFFSSFVVCISLGQSFFVSFVSTMCESVAVCAGLLISCRCLPFWFFGILCLVRLSWKVLFHCYSVFLIYLCFSVCWFTHFSLVSSVAVFFIRLSQEIIFLDFLLQQFISVYRYNHLLLTYLFYWFISS